MVHPSRIIACSFRSQSRSPQICNRKGDVSLFTCLLTQSGFQILHITCPQLWSSPERDGQLYFYSCPPEKRLELWSRSLNPKGRQRAPSAKPIRAGNLGKLFDFPFRGKTPTDCLSSRCHRLAISDKKSLLGTLEVKRQVFLFWISNLIRLKGDFTSSNRLLVLAGDPDCQISSPRLQKLISKDTDTNSVNCNVLG